MCLKQSSFPGDEKVSKSSIGVSTGQPVVAVTVPTEEYIYEEEGEDDVSPFLSRECEPEDILTIEEDDANHAEKVDVPKSG